MTTTSLPVTSDLVVPKGFESYAFWPAEQDPERPHPNAVAVAKTRKAARETLTRLLAEQAAGYHPALVLVCSRR